jgi:hypothetical protein
MLPRKFSISDNAWRRGKVDVEDARVLILPPPLSGLLIALHSCLRGEWT